ncbi:hypothetical protein [Helicovermis profundi]|uniref:Uncharacterized protein n=1 Tax=Helicovermis profundi TaxID=3065157 RepID=A0AAU9E8M3_9FIRM|nr:hypothetical protein HLPR_04380 [Clostridia bacterium S502]
MNKYTKIIGVKGFYFIKEFYKIKHHKNKIRELSEDTVAKFFKKGDCEIEVYFEETDKTILIDDFSSKEDIKKYLGKKFL